RGLAVLEGDLDGFDGRVVDVENGNEFLGVVDEIAGEFGGVGDPVWRRGRAGRGGEVDLEDDGLADVAFEQRLVGVGGEAHDVAGEGGDVAGLRGDGGGGGAGGHARGGHAADDQVHGFGDGVAHGVEEVAEPAAGAA